MFAGMVFKIVISEYLLERDNCIDKIYTDFRTTSTSVFHIPLNTHISDSFRRGSNEYDIFTGTLLTELHILGQEPIAGVNGLAVGLLGHFQNFSSIQITLC